MKRNGLLAPTRKLKTELARKILLQVKYNNYNSIDDSLVS